MLVMAKADPAAAAAAAAAAAEALQPWQLQLHAVIRMPLKQTHHALRFKALMLTSKRITADKQIGWRGTYNAGNRAGQR